jgi:uncharacterized protein (DUF488 family)
MFYDAAGHVLYHRVAETDTFLIGLDRIVERMQTHRIALMCSEEDPLVCHRHRLVARVLHQRGIPIRHIRQDGQLQSYEQVEPMQHQRLLFGEMEMDEWKSLRSVLPNPVHETSSEG